MESDKKQSNNIDLLKDEIKKMNVLHIDIKNLLCKRIKKNWAKIYKISDNSKSLFTSYEHDEIMSYVDNNKVIDKLMEDVTELFEKEIEDLEDIIEDLEDKENKENKENEEIETKTYNKFVKDYLEKHKDATLTDTAKAYKEYKENKDNKVIKTFYIHV